LSEADKTAATSQWAQSIRNLPGMLVRTATVAVVRAAGTPRLVPRSGDELELEGVCHPQQAGTLLQLRVQMASAMGVELSDVSFRVGATSSVAEVPQDTVAELGDMAKDVYGRSWRGTQAGAAQRAKIARGLAENDEGAPSKALAAAAAKLDLEGCRKGYEWSWLCLSLYDERWTPAAPSREPTRNIGLQLYGCLPQSSERLVAKVLRDLERSKAVASAQLPVAIDIEFLPDPVVVPTRLEAALTAGAACAACGDALGAGRRTCLHCPAAKAAMCGPCAAGHNDAHVTLQLASGGGGGAAAAAAAGRRLAYFDASVAAPLAIGVTLARHHPGSVCAGCGSRAFAGPLWRDATRPAPDGAVLCEACFAARPGTDADPWLCLPAFAGGEHSVFGRPKQSLWQYARTETETLASAVKVYEMFWGQGLDFPDDWRRAGLVELAPLLPQFQPRSLSIEERWSGEWMRDFTIGAAMDARKAARAGGGGGGSACPRTFEALQGMEPKSTLPLIYELPHFLTDDECDHFCRVGYVFLFCFALRFPGVNDRSLISVAVRPLIRTRAMTLEILQ